MRPKYQTFPVLKKGKRKIEKIENYIITFANFPFIDFHLQICKWHAQNEKFQKRREYKIYLKI